MDSIDIFGIALEASLWAIMVVLPIFYLLSSWIVPNYSLIKQVAIIRVEIIFLLIAFILRKMNKKISFIELLPKILLGIVLGLLIGIILLIFTQTAITLNSKGLLLNLNITNNGQ